MKKEMLLGTVLLLPLLAAAADFTPLAVKPGLWEATVTTKMQLPDAMLANVPPDRRAQMEAMMAGRGGQPTVAKSCLTQESLSKGFNFNNDPRRTCQYKLVSLTATKQVSEVTCTTEKGKSMVGRMTFEALTPESGKATIEMSADGGTKMQITVNSKYLGPDCGDVKPR